MMLDPTPTALLVEAVKQQSEIRRLEAKVRIEERGGVQLKSHREEPVLSVVNQQTLPQDVSPD